MKPLAAEYDITGSVYGKKESVVVLAFLPGRDDVPMAIIALPDGRITYCDVTALKFDEHELRALQWQTGFVS